MKPIRRRAIAKSVGATYFKRSDGCLCLRYQVNGLVLVYDPWFPTFPKNKFLEKIKK
jgi:hypothetical protein